jgi:hypothetical protein
MPNEAVFGTLRFAALPPELHRLAPKLYRPESWEQHHPKPDEPVPDERKVPDTVGATHDPVTAPERAATQHTVLILGRL